MNEQLSSPGWVDLLHRTVEEWFQKNGRDFPWRQSSNSFHILVAEVLLRRTQAHRVVGPYLDLIETYPDIRDMADADVTWLREWFRPLGLVNRAQGLVEAANTILERHGGEVPKELSEIESLPGLGRYSACAVLCLAHAGAAPMIDESSGRLLRRLLGLGSSGPAYLAHISVVSQFEMGISAYVFCTTRALPVPADHVGLDQRIIPVINSEEVGICH